MKRVSVFHDEGEIDIGIVNQYERQTGYVFPALYKRLISQHNALYPENDSFGFLDQNGGKCTSSIVFYGYDTERTCNDILYLEQRSSDHPLPPHVVVFGRDGGGNMVAFDYSDNPKGDNPKVIFVYHDRLDGNQQEFEGGYYITAYVADSFGEFMDILS